MAKGTKDWKWEYEEMLFMAPHESAYNAASSWSESLEGNEDLENGSVLIQSEGEFVMLAYSWDSSTVIEAITDGYHYGMRCYKRGEPVMKIYPFEEKEKNHG